MRAVKALSLLTATNLKLLISAAISFVFFTMPSYAVESHIVHKGKKYAVINTNWYRKKTKEVYRIVACGGGVGVKVVKTPTKKYQNKVLSCGSKRTPGKLEYKGKMLNTFDDKTYSGSTRIRESNPDILILKGCVFGGLICVEENLTRVKS